MAETTHFKFPLPDPLHYADEDAECIKQALMAVDTLLYGVTASLSCDDSAFETVQSIVDALKGKADSKTVAADILALTRRLAEVEQSTSDATITTYDYDKRGQLRHVADAKNGDVAVVDTLGLFSFSTSSTESDDDETAFSASGGVWLLQTVSLDMLISTIRRDFAPSEQSWFEFVEVTPTVAAIAPGQSVTIQVDGVVGVEGGERMVVVPPANANVLLTSRAYSNYWRRVFLVLGNPTTAALSVDTSAIWRVGVLRMESDYGS